MLRPARTAARPSNPRGREFRTADDDGSRESARGGAASARGVIDLPDLSVGAETASQILLWRTLALSAPGRSAAPNASLLPAGSCFVSDPKHCCPAMYVRKCWKRCQGRREIARTRQLLYPFFRLW